MVLTMSILQRWPTRQIDFVLAYAQADVENDRMYMQIPKGCEVNSKQAAEWVLKLKKNLYGQKQAGRVWNKYLVAKLKDIGFVQSEVDECVFFKSGYVYVLYTDDSILTGPTEEGISAIIEEMKSTGLRLTEEGNVSDFLGV